MNNEQFKLGICTLGGAGGLSTTEHIDLVAKVGWEGIFTGWDKSKTEEWANAAARNGLFYQSIHSPFSTVKYMWRTGEESRAITQMLIDCVNDCARFDIPVMVIHPFIGFTNFPPMEAGLDNYARVIEAADKAGVTLGFENVEGEPYLAAIMERFRNEPSVGFCFDTGHELCYNEGKDMLALYGDKLCHTHFNDNLGVYDPNLTWENDLHLVMGDGVVDWKGVMDRIKKTPYRGMLCCELSLSNKPNRNDHDAYAAMPIEEFYAFALERARRVRDGLI